MVFSCRVLPFLYGVCGQVSRRGVSLPACRGRWHRRCRRGCTVGRRRSVPTLLSLAFPWGKVARRQPRRMRGGTHSRRGTVGAWACLARRIPYAEPAWRKPSPWGEGGRNLLIPGGCGAYRLFERSINRTGSPPHPSWLAPCHPPGEDFLRLAGSAVINGRLFTKSASPWGHTPLLRRNARFCPGSLCPAGRTAGCPAGGP